MNNSPEGAQGSANSKTLYPYADEQLGVFTSPGNTHPFNGSEADWAAFKKACKQRAQLERQLAQSEERVKALEAGLEYIVALHASRDTLLQEMTHDKARALLSSSKTN